MRIRSRLLIAFLVLALVPLIAASAIAYLVGASIIRDQVLRQLGSTVAIQESRVKDIAAQNSERLAQVADGSMLRVHLQSYLPNHDPASLENINTNLADALTASPSFKAITVMSTDGTVITSTDKALVGTNQSASVFFKAGMKGNNVELFYTGKDGKLMHYLTGPLVLNGQQLGVVTVVATADNLMALMKDYSGLGKTGETVLGEKTPSGGAVFLGPPRFGKQTPLSTVVKTAKSSTPIEVALNGREVLLKDAVDYRGHHVLAATRFVEGTGLGLVVKIDISEAYASVNQLRNILLLIIIVAAGLVIATALVLARSVTQPIVSLTGVAEAVSSGDLTRRADIDRKDEVGTLATSFNKMTDDLVDERENLERKVAERTSELERSNLELDGYAHTVSHDLRGPMTSINLATALLGDILEDPVDEAARKEMRDVVGHIATSTNQSFALINDLLAFAEAGQNPARVEAVDIDETVARILVERDARIRDKNARVVVEGPLGTVIANPTHMYQLFNNLIVNAVKHNDSPAPLVTVRFLGEEVGGRRYEVRDNGPGITQDDLPRIFEPFFKGKSGETGVGLATVQKIVEVYGGEITACNDEGGGACFEFVLHDYEDPREPDAG